MSKKCLCPVVHEKIPIHKVVVNKEINGNSGVEKQTTSNHTQIQIEPMIQMQKMANTQTSTANSVKDLKSVNVINNENMGFIPLDLRSRILDIVKNDQTTSKLYKSGSIISMTYITEHIIKIVFQIYTDNTIYPIEINLQEHL